MSKEMTVKERKRIKQLWMDLGWEEEGNKEFPWRCAKCKEPRAFTLCQNCGRCEGCFKCKPIKLNREELYGPEK